MKNTNQTIKIYRRPFLINNTYSRNVFPRFVTLMQCFLDGFILADNIFLTYEDGEYFLYTIEAHYKNESDFYYKLEVAISKLSLENKKRIFKKIVDFIENIHLHNQAYLELNTKNIWLDKNCNVFLRPFKVNLEEIDIYTNYLCHNNKEKSFYKSPEEIFNSDLMNEKKGLLQCDVWALGCVFYELFFENIPIFKCESIEEKIYKFFEILGLPAYHEVPFLSSDYYEEVKYFFERYERINFLERFDDQSIEKKILMNFLQLDFNKRISVSGLKNYLPYIDFINDNNKEQINVGSVRKKLDYSYENEDCFNDDNSFNSDKYETKESKENISKINGKSIKKKIIQNKDSTNDSYLSFDENSYKTMIEKGLDDEHLIKNTKGTTIF